MGCNCEHRNDEEEIDTSRKGEIEPNPINQQNTNKTKFTYHKSATLPPDFEFISKKSNSKFNTIQTVSENQNVLKEVENKNIDKTKPLDDFSLYLFEHINKLREDPSSYIDIIQNSESNIQNYKGGRLIYKSNVKVALDTGIQAFEEAKLMLSNTKPMDKLKFDYNMTIKVPNREEDIVNKNYLKNQLLIKYDEGINISTSWREIINDPETCFILMIVDDNCKKKGFKRKNLLNPDYKYIGISSVLINKKFSCYITLG